MQENVFQVPTLPAFPRKSSVYCDFSAFICAFLALKTGSRVINDSGEDTCLLSLSEYLCVDELESSEAEEKLKMEAKHTLTWTVQAVL